jgi:1-deoxy-D-xylulose 5-phosphate reductoisomerase
MSAAHEVAVHMFLRGEIGYNRIYDAASAAVEAIPSSETEDLDEILAADSAARLFVRKFFNQ